MFDDILGDNILYTFINWICSIWNAFMDITWGLIGQTPQEVSPESWNMVTGSMMDMFTAIGVSLLIVFFLIGYISNVMDLKDELTYEKVIMLFVQLVVVQMAFLGATRLIPLACNAAKGVVVRFRWAGGAEAVHLSADTLSSIPWDDMGLLTVMVGLLLAFIAMIVTIVCGAIIVWSVLGRVFKIYILTPIAAVPLSTLAGGTRIQRPAINWIREFLISVFEVVIIAIVLNIGAKFIGSNVLANYFQFSEDDVLQQTCTGIFMMMINMGVVAGAVKSSEAILRKIFG